MLALDIYFHQNSAAEHQAALTLRDAVLRLRRDGAFVAVPLFRVNLAPIGPHPVGKSLQSSPEEDRTEINVLGSYEIWCPSESFSSVFSYLCMNRGDLRYASPKCMLYPTVLIPISHIVFSSIH